MYAVIETGGKQYRVEVGTELEVELLDAEAGSNINIERVLLVADGEEAAIGRPVVANAAVEAEVVRRDRGDKVIAFKYRPKARRRVKKGHRQELTILRVADIRFNGRSAAEAVRKAEADARSERQRVEEAAAKQAAEDAALAARLAKRQAEAEATQAPKRGRGRAEATRTEDAPKRTRDKTGTASTTDAPAPRRRTTKKE
jgi:large subunit ribosomal protein L21